MADHSSKTIPLRAEHIRLGARMVAFGGWEMPVQYSGILAEHHAVRQECGIFDISHMGQFLVRGSGAIDFLSSQLTNNPRKLSDGQSQYTLMLNEKGGVIDDLIIYRVSETEWLLVVNAAKIDEDWAWLASRLPSGQDVQLENHSDAYVGFAVQGPQAALIYQKWAGSPLPPRHGVAQHEGGYICRTGYTGEDGFEAFLPIASGLGAWQALVALGAKPCGLGARDTLRLESCYPLNGNDLTAETTPLEAGLGIFVDLAKGPFTGRDVLAAQKATGVTQRLVAFKMTGTSPPPRSHYAVLHQGAKVGETTSGGLSPTLGGGIGLAYVPTEMAQPGTEIALDIRGTAYPAQIVKKPFYRSPHLVS